MEDSIKPWYKHWWGGAAIVLSAIILFFLTASAFYFIGEIKTAKLRQNQLNRGLTGQKYEASNGDNYWLGSKTANISIVEFADFACPYSEKAFPTIREISQKYKDDVKFIWRDYPVVTEYSALLALAGRCAGEQGLFWLMHDKLFQNQGVIQAEQLVALANQIGADVTKFKDCLNQQKYLKQIMQDFTDGQSFLVSGTPTYFINGYKVAGDIPYDTFVKIIEQLKK
ncbi:hypothetical protein A3H09_04210 [Candidatus Falkowbacteria bacterium RIFCSPLOWO2_12_FULL_45_13]|uniref:Thioredoxin domain-containing protein n=2 Tax=Candidatus Falkowiibacteriota TaxID=1752728 RepID=A0A1F5SCY0_9BACT|nr:MAG: hypothetical protein A3H66_01820 [Candidatus Falkowbacteria bacterium RIFCSPLOWO2_02_FULL_45_21]OGF31105.1 MAG: hypothetical protein A3H09_04210 [Candidatus Falkowbacteria bacterium RIFCSPLOWO2_12_FULL_45_13]